MAAKAKTRKEDAATIIGAEEAAELEERAVLVGRSDIDEATEAMVIKAEDEAAPVPDVEKSDEGMQERPFGGATDLERARQWIAEQDKLNTTMNYWQMFDMVMMNILEAEEGDKMEMMKKAISDFSAQVDTIKAGLSDLTMMSLISKPEPILTERSEEMSEEIKPTEQAQAQGDVFDQLREMVTGAMSAGSREEAQEAIQKSFSNFAGVMRGQLDAKYPPNVEQIAREAAQAAIAPLAEKMDLVLAKMNQAPAPAQPVQKSMPYQHPAEMLTPQPVKKSIRDLARESVGLPA